MTSLLDLLVPNFAPTFFGVLFLILGGLIFYGLSKIPELLPGKDYVEAIGSIVAISFFIYGLILIFVVSFLTDLYRILSDNLNLSLFILLTVVTGVIVYFLFFWKKEKKGGKKK